MNAGMHVNCDLAVAKAAACSSSAEHPKLVLTTTILASSLAFIDGSVVNVGLPAIGATFHAGAEALPWVINAYLLPLSALLLLGGGAGDRFGRVRLLIIGTLFFGVGSVACAIAPSLAWLLFARGVQGMGAALLMPNSLAILGNSFSGEARGRAIGIWASMGAVMGAAGPVFGGWLIDTVGWRSIFLVNVPFALGAIGLALAFVRDTTKDKKNQPLDIQGGILATLSLGALTWALTVGSGPAGWTAVAIIALVAGFGLLIAFIWIEKLRGENAMMPLALFASPNFVGLTLLTVLLYGALGGLVVLIPYVLIRAAAYSGTAAGAALLPFAVILALVSPLIGGLSGRIGARIPLSVGSLLVSAGFFLTLRISADGDYWTEVLPAMVVIAFGMSGAVAPLTTAILASVDARHTGAASGLNSAVARTGGLVATALLGGILGTVGSRLIIGFHVAAVVCALASLGASAAAFFLVKDIREDS
jgi:EmrB/QacA subfamily drug resistance transporter